MRLFRPLFGRKPLIQQAPRPRWLTILLVVFFGYAAIKGTQKSTPENPNPVHDAVTKLGETVSKEELEHTIGTYKNILFPRYSSIMDIHEITLGKGQPLVCGQEATIAYKTHVENGKPLPYAASKDAPLTFRLGDGAVIPALEQGITGMRVGGKRELVADSAISYGIKEFAQKDARLSPDERATINVELLSVAPEIPDISATPYRIAHVDDNGKGGPIFCGEKTKLKIAIWTIEGKLLFSSAASGKPITFTPGKSEIFLGLEQGVIGMARGAKRLLIVPPALQKPLRENPAALTFSLPEHQTILVDVEALP